MTEEDVARLQLDSIVTLYSQQRRSHQRLPAGDSDLDRPISRSTSNQNIPLPSHATVKPSNAKVDSNAQVVLPSLIREETGCHHRYDLHVADA